MTNFALMALWTVIGFAAGSLPFSVWIGSRWLRQDVRGVGDANPGATNVWRAGGRWSAALALVLDMAKGALPVASAYFWSGIHGLWLVPVALSPILGHAFSPLLQGRGGKAVAVTGGVWMGLTLWEGPAIGGLGLVIGAYFFGANGWAVVLALVAILLYVTLAPPAWNGLIMRPEAGSLGWIAAGNLAITAWRHRRDLATPPRFRRRQQPPIDRT